ncbi:hypothetical protein H2200_006255 [Cladophialophora chaetospira]|uniref:Uncharacterized protein n=1 Tax=Cladophialophora chaetospira TaxID=386627 RepID=A0AA38XAQ5_9EURO|nr:hypothetical protein H2200_006255 [Cladophialophora chaetospira]
MDGHCRRCGSIAYNVVGEYCPHCGDRLFTRPAATRNPPPAAASQVPTMPTALMPSDRNNAARPSNQLHADLDTHMQDYEVHVDRPPICRPRNARSRSPARDRNHEQEISRFRNRDQSLPSDPRRPSASATQDPQQSWCLWCHYAGHFAYHDCRTKTRPPPSTIKTLDSHWPRYYSDPKPKDVHSPMNLLHIRDIAHQLILHCNKFATWVKRRDTFLTVVMQDLKDYAACYQAWKYCMARSNIAANEYLIAIQEFAGELYNSKELIQRPLLKLATMERQKFRFTDADLTAMESDDRRLSRFLNDLKDDTHKIRISRDEYGALLAKFESIRTEYLFKWQEVADFQTELVNQVGQKSPEIQQSRKIKEAFNCLQAANPVPHKTRLDCISVEDVFLPDIATIRQQWDLL